MKAVSFRQLHMHNAACTASSQHMPAFAASSLLLSWERFCIMCAYFAGIEVDEEVVLMTTKGEAIAVGIAQARCGTVTCSAWRAVG